MSTQQQRITAALQSAASDLSAYSQICSGTDRVGEAILAQLQERTNVLRQWFTNAPSRVQPSAAEEIRQLFEAYESEKAQCGAPIAEALQHQSDLLSLFLIDEGYDVSQAKYWFRNH
jgi:hypothetical protein